MSKAFDTYQKRRLVSSYISVVVSITLVLILLGFLGVLILNSKRVSDYFKEQVVVSVFLKDTAKDVDVTQLEKSLKMANYVKSTQYITKEEAATIMKDEIGEDFMDFLGHNPLKNSIDISLNADYVSAEKLESISTELEKKPFVDEINYDADLIRLMNNNVKTISFWVIIASAILTLIAFLLINSAIRLTIYSKRFTINTMQMVGATKQFIRKPFIWRIVSLGILGAIIALLVTFGFLFFINKTFPDLAFLNNPTLLIGLGLGILCVGILITWLSTYFATQRFLNLKTDKLYY